MPSKIIDLSSLEETKRLEQLEEVSSLIKRVRKFVFPSDVSYCFGSPVHKVDSLPEAVKSLLHSTGTAQYALYAADIDALAPYVGTVSPLARKLCSKFWPGPLDIIMGGSGGSGTIEVNSPSNKTARALLAEVGAPIAAVSCPIELRSAGDFAAKYGEEADLILYDGLPKFTMGLTVVDVSKFAPKIVMTGSIPDNLVSDLLYRQVLFVCTGNTCRSPMARFIFDKIISERRMNDVIKSDSCGIFAGPDMPMSENARRALEKQSVKHVEHSSKSVTEELIRASDIVFCMERAQVEHIKDMCPDAGCKVMLLDTDDSDISDPIGMPLDVYEECLTKIINAINARLSELLKD